MQNLTEDLDTNPDSLVCRDNILYYECNGPSLCYYDFNTVGRIIQDVKPDYLTLAPNGNLYFVFSGLLYILYSDHTYTNVSVPKNVIPPYPNEKFVISSTHFVVVYVIAFI